MARHKKFKEDPSVKDEFESLLRTDELSEGLLYQFARKGVYHTKLVNEYKKKIPKRMKSRSTSKTKYTKINYKKLQMQNPPDLFKVARLGLAKKVRIWQGSR